MQSGFFFLGHPILLAQECQSRSAKKLFFGCLCIFFASEGRRMSIPLKKIILNKFKRKPSLP